MDILFSIRWILIASIWYFGNGVLHDISVISKHKGGYDRELLRLLMDGHVLILTGIVMFVCYQMMLSKIQYGALIAIVLAIAMLAYCAMIWPFLKSIGTIAVSILVIAVSVYAYRSFPDIDQIMQTLVGQK